MVGRARRPRHRPHCRGGGSGPRARGPRTRGLPRGRPLAATPARQILAELFAVRRPHARLRRGRRGDGIQPRTRHKPRRVAGELHARRRGLLARIFRLGARQGYGRAPACRPSRRARLQDRFPQPIAFRGDGRRRHDRNRRIRPLRHRARPHDLVGRESRHALHDPREGRLGRRRGALRGRQTRARGLYRRRAARHGRHQLQRIRQGSRQGGTRLPRLGRRADGRGREAELQIAAQASHRRFRLVLRPRRRAAGRARTRRDGYHRRASESSHGGRRGQQSGDALLPVRPLPHDLGLAHRGRADEPSGFVERHAAAAVEQQLHGEHQYRGELLARRGAQPHGAAQASVRLHRQPRANGPPLGAQLLRLRRLGHLPQLRHLGHVESRGRVHGRSVVGQLADGRRMAQHPPLGALPLHARPRVSRRARLSAAQGCGGVLPRLAGGGQAGQSGDLAVYLARELLLHLGRLCGDDLLRRHGRSGHHPRVSVGDRGRGGRVGCRRRVAGEDRRRVG